MFVTNLNGSLDWDKLSRDCGYDDDPEMDNLLLPSPILNEEFPTLAADECKCRKPTENDEDSNLDYESLGYGFNGRTYADDSEVRGPNFRKIGGVANAGGPLTLNDGDSDDVLPLPVMDYRPID